MKILAICPTFNRAHLIPNVIAQFEMQEYSVQDRHLLIYDDAGQFDSQEGDGWSLTSTPNRHATLGDKFATLARMAIDHCGTAGWDWRECGIALWEDDDVLFPNYLSTHSATLDGGADWSAPSKILANDGVGRGKWHVSDARGRHHGAWAFRISAYVQAGGYPREQTEGFDLALAGRFAAAGITAKDTLETGCGPLYLYRWFSIPGSMNGSAFGDEIMERQGIPSQRYPGSIVPKLDEETEGYYREFGFI